MSLLSHPRPAAGGLSTLRRDSFFCILALLALLQAGFLSAHLVYPDLNLDYPFMDGDSWDWIANGLRLAGHDVRSSGRPPLLPLTIAFLERLSLLPWLPVLLQVLFLGTILAFYDLASRLFNRGAAFAAALALLVNQSLVGMSLQVMADLPASCLLFLASRSFLLARYPWAGLAGGLSAVTQPAAWLVTAPAALTVWLRRRGHLRSRQLWIGVAAFASLPALWLIAEPGVDVPVRHWGLLALHAGSVPFYARALLSFLGWAGLLLLLLGLGVALREAWRGADAPLFIVASFAVLTGFFVFLYDFDAERFLVYPIWMAGLLIAGCLAHLPRRAAFMIAAVLLIAGSALPLDVHAQVRAARHVSQRFDPKLVRQDHSALYLYQQPTDGGGRYRVITRLGNALLKRVKYVPAAWFEPWRLSTVPVGRIGNDTVYRARLPGMRETWLLVAPGVPVRPREDGWDGWDGAGRRQARHIASLLKGWDGYVALLPPEGPPQPWQLYLPFLVETTELYVPQPGQEQEILEIFAAAPSLGERRIGPVVVRRTELLGRRASLVRGTG